jgi:hypothetical protein
MEDGAILIGRVLRKQFEELWDGFVEDFFAAEE